MSATEEILGKGYDARLLRRTLHYVRPHWRIAARIAVLAPLAIVFEIAQPYLAKVIIDEHLRPRRPEGLGALAALLGVCVALEYAARRGQTFSMQLLGQRSMDDLRNELHRHVMGMGMAFFDRTPIGRILTRLTNDVEAMIELFGSGIVAATVDLAKLATIVGWMLYLHPRLALLTFVALPPLLLVTELFRVLARRTFRAIKVQLARINQFLAERLAGMKVIQLHRQESAAAMEFNRESVRYRDLNRSAISYDATLFALVEAIGTIAVAVIIWYGGSRLAGTEGIDGGVGSSGDRVITLGLLVAFIEYVNKFFIPIRDLSSKYTTMQSAMASAERIFSLLDTHQPDAPTAPTSEVVVPIDRDAKLLIDRVRFRYGEEALFEDLTLQIGAGETIAVVGPTGAGKSTLGRILTRLYDIEGGRVLLDGSDLRTIPIEQLRRRVGSISQDVFLFAGTVAENISIGDDRISRSAIERAYLEVGLHERLGARGGLEATVAVRGSDLSAGERQLIAFARVLARDPEVLILDEATASVDPEAERLIEGAMATVMRGRTSIVIAHRLATVRRATRIVAIDRGRIVEEGRHEELLRRGGLYARLHALQGSDQ